MPSAPSRRKAARFRCWTGHGVGRGPRRRVAGRRLWRCSAASGAQSRGRRRGRWGQNWSPPTSEEPRRSSQSSAADLGPPSLPLNSHHKARHRGSAEAGRNSGTRETTTNSIDCVATLTSARLNSREGPICLRVQSWPDEGSGVPLITESVGPAYFSKFSRY